VKPGLLLAIAVALACCVPLAAADGSLPDQTLEATSPDGADADLTGLNNCSHGNPFPITQTAVSCDEGTFTVTVQDTTAPTIEADNVTDTTTDPSGKAVSYSVTSTDVVGVTETICSPSSGSHFILGPTPVTCTAHDAAGNTAEK